MTTPEEFLDYGINSEGNVSVDRAKKYAIMFAMDEFMSYYKSLPDSGDLTGNDDVIYGKGNTLYECKRIAMQRITELRSQLTTTP